MVPLNPTAARYVRSWLEPPEGPGLLALRHAMAYRRPDLRCGDDPVSPRSVILAREGDGRLEAFGAGEPEPSVGWLVGRRRGFTLHAPDAWLDALRDRVGEVERAEVETWSGSGAAGPATGAARRLTPDDLDGFAETVPAWGLRGWGSYPALMRHGAAFGVSHGAGFAALAWVFDRAGSYEALGVYTVPRFRRLGLGRAAASALIDQVVRRRGNVALWSAAPGNTPSRALARSLGFSVVVTETLLRWTPS